MLECISINAYLARHPATAELPKHGCDVGLVMFSNGQAWWAYWNMFGQNGGHN